MRVGVADIERTPFECMTELPQPVEVRDIRCFPHLGDRGVESPVVLFDQFLLKSGVVDTENFRQVFFENPFHVSFLPDFSSSRRMVKIVSFRPQRCRRLIFGDSLRISGIPRPLSAFERLNSLSN
ncbi:hypothetical protein SDC9_187170 [bioreactor metagenome]|uniref:Uncharacterized protein n=1 Tax=bioreactor metagenome TaxID=1076179 RepID=A0A645HMH0_9ZZZZ